ncbi:MAG: type VI secretion system tube protein Hcp [Aquisalimonadaceae bacterium]
MSIFMHYADIGGEASDSNHTQWINIAAARMGSVRQITAGSSTRNDRESSVTQLRELAMERHMDKSSPELFAAHAIGKGHDLTLHFTKTGGGDGADTYLELVLKHALISSYEFSAHEESPRRPMELLTVSYTGIEYKYIEFDEDGRMVSPKVFAYDPATNGKL